MDDQLKKSLQDDGFSIMHSVFSSAELDRLEFELDQFFPKTGAHDNAESDLAGARSRAGQTTFEINRALSRSVYLRRCALFKRVQKLASEFLGCNARYTFDHAIYKYPGANSAIGWHQDQAYQRKDLCMRSMHFWIPLQDSSAGNGGLEFSRGSHNLPLRDHRTINNSGTLEVRDATINQVVSCDVPRGGLSIHLPNTLHRSLENTSGAVRKAWILHFSPLGKWDILRPKNLSAQLSRIMQ
jgi:ectoine hydroxylase-related dioxygenase (phytanoyl-CoA dioxygenase family)